MAGGFAGLFVSFIEGPTDFFKCQLQMNKRYKGFIDCVSSVRKENGMRGCFQGKNNFF